MKIEKNILKNAQVNIAFPWANANDQNSLHIYEYTIQSIIDIEESDVMFSFYKSEGELYNIGIDSLLCSLGVDDSRNYGFPSIKLVHKGKTLNMHEICIMVSMENPVINLYFKEKFISRLEGLSFWHPPCRMKELTIQVIGDLKYYDFENY